MTYKIKQYSTELNYYFLEILTDVSCSRICAKKNDQILILKSVSRLHWQKTSL